MMVSSASCTKIDMVVDMSVQKQRQVPMVQKVQKIVDLPQVEYIDRADDVPVLKQWQVPLIQKVQMIVGIPKMQCNGRVVDIQCRSSSKCQ